LYTRGLQVKKQQEIDETGDFTNRYQNTERKYLFNIPISCKVMNLKQHILNVLVKQIFSLSEDG